MAVGTGAAEVVLSPSEAIDAVSTEEVDEAPGEITDVEVEASEVESDENPDDSGLPQDGIDSGEEIEAQGEDEEAEQVSKPSKAQERIRKLVTERNELSERFEQREAAFARQLQAMQARSEEQYQQQLERYEAQNRLLQERLDSQRAREEREDFEKLPLKDQIERQAANRAKSEFEKILNERVGSVEKQLQEERAMRAQAEEQASRVRRINELSRQAGEARGVLFKGIPETELGESSEVLNDMFLGYAGGKGVYPKEAAPVFRKALENFARSYMKNVSRTNKEQIAKSRSVPSSGVAKKSGAAAKGVKKQIDRSGFNGRNDPDELFDNIAKQLMGS